MRSSSIMLIPCQQLSTYLRRSVRLLFLFTVISFRLYSQEQASLTDWQASLTRSYNSIVPFKIHLTFNQPKYAAGDTAYFSGVIMNSKELKMLDGKKLVNIKLIAQNSKSILDHRFLFIDGTCAGQLPLPSKLAAGIYTLVAYTDDMDLKYGLFYQTGLYISGEKEFAQTKANSSKTEIVATLVDDNNSLAVILTTPDVRSETMRLLLSKKDKVLSVHELKFDNENRQELSINSVEKGQLLLSVLNNKDEVLVEKSIFVPSNDLPMIKLTLNKDQFTGNEQISASVQVEEKSGTSFRGVLTASVMRGDLFSGADLTSANDQLITLDIAKKIPQQQSIIKPVPNYYFKGKVVLHDQGKIVPDSTLITFYFNKSDFVYGVYVFKGEFSFPLFKNFEDEEVFYVVHDHGKSLKSAMIILPETKLSVEDRQTVSSDKPDAYYLFSENKKSILSSYHFYLNKDKSEPVIEDEFIESDHEIVPDKFEKFNTVSEMLSNIVPSTRYRKSAQHETVRIFLKEGATYANEDPIYIIDGIMTDSTSVFLQLDPTRIANIKILRTAAKLTRYGAIGKNGLIFVKTKNADPLLIARPWRTLTIPGISNSISYKPMLAREHGALKIPDVRSSLYWNPKLILDNQNSTRFDFYTGGITGSLRIRINGLTEAGETFFYEKEIDVLFNKQ